MKSYLNKIHRVSGVTYTGGSEEAAPVDRSAVEKKKALSSVVKLIKTLPLKELPLLSETPMQKREALFKQKLELCCTVFAFDDPEADQRGKYFGCPKLIFL